MCLFFLSLRMGYSTHGYFDHNMQIENERNGLKYSRMIAKRDGAAMQIGVIA